MKLVEISNELLNEASKNPLSVFRSIFKAAGINFAEVEVALLLGLKQIDNKILSITKATPVQVEMAFKTKPFKKYVQILARNYIANNDKIIDGILKKHPINTTQGSKAARAEIGNTLGVNKSLADEIFAIKKPKPGPIPPKPPTPPTPPIPEDVNGFIQFLQGLKLSGYEYLIKNFSWANKTFKEKYYQNLGDINALQQEFNNLATTVLAKIDPKNPKIVNEELSKMANILAKVGYRKELNLKTIWDSWKVGMPTQFAKDLKTYENPKFQQLVSYFENINPSKMKNPPIATYSKMEGIMSLFKKRELAWNKFQRVLFTGTHLDPRTASEIGNSITIYGFWKSVGKGVGQKLILGFVVFPTYYSILKTALDYLDLHTGIKLKIGNKEDIKNFDVEQNTWGNIGDMIYTTMSNFINIWPIIGNDYNRLISWSPALWALDKDRFSKLTPEEAAAKIRETLPKVQEEMDNNKKEVKDAVNQDPSLIDKVKNQWNNLIDDSSNKKEDFVNPFQ